MRGFVRFPVFALLLAVALAGCLQGAPAGATGDDVPSLGALHVVDVTDRSATVTYQIEGAAIHTVVRYGPAGNGSILEEDVPASTGGTRVVIGDLRPDTPYRVSVRSASSGEVPSLQGRFQTLPEGDEEQDRNGPKPSLASSQIWVRPGDAYHFNGTSWCTLGFILRDPSDGTVFGLTAGHCFDDGDLDYDHRRVRPQNVTIRLDDGTPIGHLEIYEWGRTGPLTATAAGPTWMNVSGGPTSPGDGGPQPNRFYDWALIRFDDRVVPHVSPSVRRWGGPSGVGPYGAVDAGDVVCMTGQGEPLEGAWPDGRCGTFRVYMKGGWNRTVGPVHAGYMRGHDWIGWDGPAYWGDSGSPVIDHATGEALGIVTEGPLVPLHGTVVGPTVKSILARTAEVGYDLELVTAPYESRPPIAAG